MAHSHSRTWTSQNTSEKHRFKRINNLLYHFVPNSPFVPHTHSEWVRHQASMKDMEVQKMHQDIERKRVERRSANVTKATTPFICVEDQRHRFEDNRSTVLAMPSVWAPYFKATPERPDAPWPNLDELRYEGDDRAKTNVGRFLPLPRRPGNETVTWKAREQLMFLSTLDWVGPLAFDGTPVNSPLETSYGELAEEVGWGKPLMDDLVEELGKI